jgi:hypothetical protein
MILFIIVLKFGPPGGLIRGWIEEKIEEEKTRCDLVDPAD